MGNGTDQVSNPTDPLYLAIVVPAYNEETRLKNTLQALADYYNSQKYSWQVTVVSDGSSDGTAALVEQVATTDPRFHLDHYFPNRGKGYAVRRGILGAKAKYILFCDADLATPQEETAKLLEKMEAGADIAIGSRPLKESNLVVRQPWHREMLGRAFNMAVRSLAVPGIHDTQCGFKMFTLEAADEVFCRCSLDGFSFDLEALMIARDLGLKIEEVPIRWSHQDGSKVSLMRDGPKMLLDLVKIRLRGKRALLKIKNQI